MLQIDRKKAGTRIECQGKCSGATKHVEMLYGSRVVWVCTICENTLAASRSNLSGHRPITRTRGVPIFEDGLESRLEPVDITAIHDNNEFGSLATPCNRCNMPFSWQTDIAWLGWQGLPCKAEPYTPSELFQIDRLWFSCTAFPDN